LTSLVVVPDRCCHHEDALCDTYSNTLERTSAVKLRVNLPLECPLMPTLSLAPGGGETELPHSVREVLARAAGCSPPGGAWPWYRWTRT